MGNYLDCERCLEPSKCVTGFWDGDNCSGRLYDCNALTCLIKHVRTVRQREENLNRNAVIAANQKNGVDVLKLKRMRLNTKCILYDMSRILHIFCAEYSAFECQRKSIPLELYVFALSYLESCKTNFDLI